MSRPLVIVAGAMGVVGLIALWQHDQRERARAAAAAGGAGVAAVGGGGSGAAAGGGTGAGTGAVNATAAGGRWVCDMHCEPGTVRGAPAMCPVCRMALRRWEDVGYSMSVEPAPGVTVRAGEPARLLARVLDPSGVDARLRAMPEGDVSVMAFNDRLNWSAWTAGRGVVNEAGAARFEVLFTPPTDGSYVLFGEARLDEGTTGGAVVVGRAAIDVGPAMMGSMGSPEASPKEDYDVVKHVGPGGAYEVRVRCNGQRFFAGEDSYVRVGVDLGGAAVTDLEPLIDGPGSASGVKGRLVVVSTDTTFFQLATPLPMRGGVGGGGGVSGTTGVDARIERVTAGQIAGAEAMASLNGRETDLVYLVRLPRVGMYRVFTEMRHKGEPIRAEFVIDAQALEGAAAEPAPMDHSRH